MTLLKRLAGYVDSAERTTTGTLVGGPCILRGIHLHDDGGAVAGSMVLRDGGAAGPIMVTINTPGGGIAEDVTVPGGGIKFATDMHVTLSNVADVTVFYSR